jgi:hypothetical protein
VGNACQEIMDALSLLDATEAIPPKRRLARSGRGR